MCIRVGRPLDKPLDRSSQLAPLSDWQGGPHRVPHHLPPVRLILLMSKYPGSSASVFCDLPKVNTGQCQQSPEHTTVWHDGLVHVLLCRDGCSQWVWGLAKGLGDRWIGAGRGLLPAHGLYKSPPWAHIQSRAEQSKAVVRWSNTASGISPGIPFKDISCVAPMPAQTSYCVGVGPSQPAS